MLFGGAGALAYLTFGSDVKAVVLVNLDSTNKFTQAVSPLTSQMFRWFDKLGEIGPIPIFYGDSLVYPTSILPGRAYFGEWAVCEER